jgi:hypothetical protein
LTGAYQPALFLLAGFSISLSVLSLWLKKPELKVE